jgi:hypothetical protein
MPSYLNHFHSFIEVKLPTFEDCFTKEDMVAWVQARDNKTTYNIVEHLLKRTTNYDLRDDNEPPSRIHDDLFFMVVPNLFRRYQAGVDPEPFHLNPTGGVDPATLARYRSIREKRNLASGRFAYEEELQMFLREQPEALEKGLRLKPGGIEFRTPAGLIDLLCLDVKGDLVAIELKVAGTSDQVAGQLSRYLGWLEENLTTEGQSVRGIIVARSISEKLRLSLRRVPGVDAYEYELKSIEGKQKVNFRLKT